MIYNKQEGIINNKIGNLNMLRMLKEADRPALLTLIGCILTKFAAGILGIWGATNIYFFSYLKNHGTHITPLTNSIILLCTIIPSTFAMMFATALTKRYGYKKVIRICGLLFAILPFAINIHINLFILGLCYLVVPISCLSISSIAVLNCLWSQYPKHLNKVSGIAVLAFSLGSIVFNLLFVTFTNPTNQQAIIDQNKQAYFPSTVADNIFKAANINYLIAGTTFMLGSCLVTKKEDMQQQSEVHVDQLAEESPHVVNAIQMNTQKSDKQTAKSQQNDDGITDKLPPTSSKSLQNPQIKTLRLRDALKDSKFMLLLWISYLVPLYIIYLCLYMKLIYMPILNDDHYLAMCAIVVTVGGIMAAPIWGCIGDSQGFKKTLLIFILSDFASKVFGLFCSQKWNIVLMYLFLSFNDKGLITMIGPGLIQMFGLQMATQLIPYKGISVCLAYVTVPVFQIIMGDYSAYKNILGMFVFLSVIAVGLVVYFYRNMQYSKYDEKAARKMSKQGIEQNLQGYFP